jgi:phosphatidylethanolamine-binding protein (PEBP) family uncharacterized protein
MAGIDLRSPSFGDHQPVPARHAKNHDNLSPALEWSGVPEEAVELADAGAPVPAVEGRNDFGEEGYGGPLPPVGDAPHRYVFEVYAAAAPLGLTGAPSAEELRRALDGKELASGTLVGTYQR